MSKSPITDTITQDTTTETNIIQSEQKPKDIITETLSKQDVETKPHDEDVPNEVTPILRKTCETDPALEQNESTEQDNLAKNDTLDDTLEVKTKLIKNKATAILESWSHLQEVKFKIPKNVRAVQRAQHEREVEQAAAENRKSEVSSTSAGNKIEVIYHNNHALPWSYYEKVPLFGSGSRPDSPPNLLINKPVRKRPRPSR